jgi:integrase
MAKEPIRKIVLRDGKTVRYRLVVDIGTEKDPETGQEKRKQFTGTYDKLKQARAELSRIRHELNTGTFVQPSSTTLNAELDKYEAGLRKADATKANCGSTLKWARSQLGERELQELEKADFDDLVTWMLTSARQRGVEQLGAGLGARSVLITLGHLQKALDIAVKERRIGYNPVRLVNRPEYAKREHELWSDEEEDVFFAEVAGDRIAAPIELFARALRPEELCGLRWTHLDPKEKTAAVGKIVRTEVLGKPVEKKAKTKAGERDLLLDDHLVAMLEEWKLRQLVEKRTAGAAYHPDPHGGYVLCDDLGRPWTPTRLRRYIYALMDRAAVRRVTPYEAMRHAAGSRLSRAGVAPQVIATWMGHTNPSFTADNYMHTRPQDLAAARDALERRGKERDDGVLRPVGGERESVARDGADGEVLGAAAAQRRERGRGRVAGQRRRPDAPGGRGTGRGAEGGAAR